MKITIKTLAQDNLSKNLDKRYRKTIHLTVYQFLLKDLDLKTCQGRLNMDLTEEDVGSDKNVLSFKRQNKVSDISLTFA